MDFLIWKVEHKGSEISWFNFSIKGPDSPPLILTGNQFVFLFPIINPEEIPLAPAVKTINIQGILK